MPCKVGVKSDAKLFLQFSAWNPDEAIPTVQLEPRIDLGSDIAIDAAARRYPLLVWYGSILFEYAKGCEVGTASLCRGLSHGTIRSAS